MDGTQAFEVVTGRMKEREPPELAMKIVGFLLLKYGAEEMIRLAHSPDQAFECVVHTLKNELHTLPPNHNIPPPPPVVVDIPPQQFNPFSPRGFSSPVSIEGPPMPNWDARVLHDQPMSGSPFSPLQYHEALADLQNRARSLSLGDRYESEGLANFYPDETFGNVSGRSRRSPSLPDFPAKPCHYFSRGFCKNGNSCRYSHEQTSPESLSPIFDPGMNLFVNDEHMFFPGSLNKLEFEITRMLKMNGGEPIPIASLPSIYSATYGRPLQADGYLTESQRNGKAGFGLTKLLARLRNSICIIDKPHGQHSIILAEDVPKYFEYRSGRNNPGPIVSGSRQIYLTFPAESTFNEDDVAQYFSTFGKVEDVRMPCQQERMFGFVTFSSPETVRKILLMGNPHSVGGSRVLVKPYREKSKLPDRRYMDNPIYYSHPYADLDSEFLSTPRGLESSRLLRKQQPPMEEYVQQGLDEQRLMGFQLARQYDSVPDSPNNQITADDATNHFGLNYTGLESAQEVGLPDSPFNSPISSSVAPTTTST
uniref:Uncharacterized protein n=1 Tax=Kalanchoe fedtschenkoi TaxID=63787 RepID=A0A7N0TZ33_KALFE